MASVRHFLEIGDVTAKELDAIVLTALKWRKQGYPKTKPLAGKNVALIFQKPSTRTRVSFEAAVSKLGGNSMYLSANELQLGRGESVEDTGKVLSRYVDCIVARVFSHRDLIELSKNGRVPVVNALSDQHHPCQALADIMTIYMYSKKPYRAKVAFVGDGNNVCVSLMQACAATGIDISVASPPEYRPPENEVKKAQKYAEHTGASIVLTDNPVEAVKDADFVYTDVFVSMGQESEKQRKLAAFLPRFQVNSGLMTYAKPNAKFMHCMPMHLNEEVTPDVAYGPQSIIYDQAENRMHTEAALLKFLLR
ncbi:MAG: ornithine carbamoyltransferase [Candidatus Caldarchaeum sp.]|nr:ornithine carbamoyltransferase [Candidatus Caldarchaeum sp.]MCX8200482.1 ornithine carbamoyltransferase [Candidatus Caldarchaeum sp.]MDW8435114.1 ornithine carbamoyltransferase [Candidatus Caldarchaeum sp.]